MLTCERGQVGSSAVLEVHSGRGSLGVAGLDWKQARALRRGGRVCLSMRTEELQTH